MHFSLRYLVHEEQNRQSLVKLISRERDNSDKILGLSSTGAYLVAHHRLCQMRKRGRTCTDK
jgi:hypothetical protein